MGTSLSLLLTMLQLQLLTMELSHQIYHTLCLPDMVERIISTIFSTVTVTLQLVLSSGRDRTSTPISLGVLLVWELLFTMRSLSTMMELLQPSHSWPRMSAPSLPGQPAPSMI